ncbi:MAG: ABC transporter ATP-binding protein [Clostridia bacterium]
MKKVLGFLKPYTLQIVVVVILVFIQSMADLYLPNLMSNIISKGVLNQDMDVVYKIGFEMIGVVIIGMTATIIAGLIASVVAAGFSKSARKHIFEKVENFSKAEFNKINASSLITRTTNDVTQVQTFLVMALRMMVSAPLICIGGIIMALQKDASLSSIFIVVLPVVLLVIGLTARKIIPIMNVMQKKIDRITQIAREKLVGVKVIRAFNMEKHERKRYDEANADLYNTTIKSAYIMSGLMPLMMLIIQINMAAILWFGSKRVELYGMEIGDLMAYIQYANQIMFAVIMLTMVFVLIPRAIVSMKRIAEVLDIPFSIKEKKVTNVVDRKVKKGQIEFKNVSFNYAKNADPVLKNISFKVEEGETLAIIGGTGCGKTTLLELMLRFYDTTKGEVLIGGQNVKDLSLEALRSMIGYVPQKAFLFSGNIEDNIRYGKEDATDVEVKAAAEVACATDFIDTFHSKFKHHIAQGGTNLSGGQKQRISIARAAVKNPDIYIFDDSFSALDYKTDTKVRKALETYAEKATKVVVAQRVSTVLNADKIMLLEDGEISALGTHKELYKTSKAYKEIVESQISKEEAAESGR